MNIDYKESFYYKYEINYKKQKKEVSYPSKSYTFLFKEALLQIEYLDKTTGFFKTKTNKLLLQNTIILNEDLNKYITYDVFSNNNFGVQKTESIYDTITLKSVTYK